MPRAGQPWANTGLGQDSPSPALRAPWSACEGLRKHALGPGTATACQAGTHSANHRGPDPAGAKLCHCTWWHRGTKPSLPPPFPHQGLLPSPTAWSCLVATPTARALANHPVWMDQCPQDSRSHAVQDTSFRARQVQCIKNRQQPCWGSEHSVPFARCPGTDFF